MRQRISVRSDINIVHVWCLECADSPCWHEVVTGLPPPPSALFAFPASLSPVPGMYVCSWKIAPTSSANHPYHWSWTVGGVERWICFPGYVHRFQFILTSFSWPLFSLCPHVCKSPLPSSLQTQHQTEAVIDEIFNHSHNYINKSS